MKRLLYGTVFIDSQAEIKSTFNSQTSHFRSVQFQCLPFIDQVFAVYDNDIDPSNTILFH